MDIFEGHIHTCPICKKEFFGRKEWAYKRRMPNVGNYYYMCSWPCLQKFDEKHAADKMKRRMERKERRLANGQTAF